LANVEFWAYCPRRELAACLASADIGLVTQSAPTLGSVVPSKIYSLMAAGRPILYIGPRGATPHRLIEDHGCGWSFSTEEAGAVTELLTRLAEDRQALAEAGRRARRALETHYERHSGTVRVLDAIVKAGATLPALPTPEARTAVSANGPLSELSKGPA
jgi:glycosyltransferase involved in cell wall biosynthesis